MSSPWSRTRPPRRRAPGFGRDVAPIRAARQARHEVPAKPRRHRTPVYGFVALGLLAAFAAPAAIQSTGLVDLRLPASITSVLASAPARPASAIGFCPPEFRRGGGGVSCITDGDSGVEDGEPWRLVASDGGVDAPEIGSPACSAERSAGERAKSRLRSLMSGGYEMSGWQSDRYGRRLVQITLADGRDAGDVLLDEGLAQGWPNSGNPWCGR